MRLLSILLFATVLVLVGGSVCHAATGYLIVTSDVLAPSFQDFADAKTTAGFVTELVTVEEIAAQAVPGRDVAEQIRNYIRDVYLDGALRFVLLGGDVAQVPTRMAFNDFYSGQPPEIATDLYFAALDGDWDANGNGVFCEVDVDLADLDPEVAVGRAPVNTVDETDAWVAKTSEYEATLNTGRRDAVLFLGEVLFPSGWLPGEPISLDGAEICETVRVSVDASPVPYTPEMLYENDASYPGSSHLTLASTMAGLESGQHGVVMHVGHGWETSMSVGSEILGPAEALALTNGPDHFVLITEVPGAAAFHNDSILEDFVRNPDGGAVVTIGWSHISFASAAAAFLDEIGHELFVEDNSIPGEALNTIRANRAADSQGNTVWRMNQLAINLLGDPSIAIETVVPTAAPMAQRIHALSVEPNPFNPIVSVQFDVITDRSRPLPVRVEVFDLAGHRVRTLFAGSVNPGPQSMPWDGRTDSGVSLSSGVYVITVQSGITRLSTKAVLLK